MPILQDNAEQIDQPLYETDGKQDYGVFPKQPENEISPREELKLLSQRTNVTERPKGVYEDDSILQQLDADGQIKALKRHLKNSADMDFVEGQTDSYARHYGQIMGQWEREVTHRQALINDPQSSLEDIQRNKEGLIYAQRKLTESTGYYRATQAMKRRNMSEVWLGAGETFLGLGSDLGYALKQYGETAASNDLKVSAPSIEEAISPTQGAIYSFKQIGKLISRNVGPEKIIESGERTAEFFDIAKEEMIPETGPGFRNFVARSGGRTVPWLLATAYGEAPVIAAGMVAGHGSMRRGLEESGVKDKATLEKSTYIYGTLSGALMAVVPVRLIKSWSKPVTREFYSSIGRASAKIASETSKVTAAQTIAMELSSFSQTYGITDANGKDLDWQQIGQQSLEVAKESAVAGLMFGGFGEARKIGSGAYRIGKEPVSPEPSAKSVDTTEPQQPKPTEEIQQAETETRVELDKLETVRSPEADTRRAELNRKLIEDSYAKAEEDAAPDFEMMKEILPIDEAGDSDVTGLPKQLNERYGKENWNELTAEEKIEFYNEFAPDGQEIIPKIPKLLEEAMQQNAETIRKPDAVEPSAPEETGIASDLGKLGLFRDALQAGIHRQEWRSAIKASPKEMQTLIDDGLKIGLLRKDKDGVIRRSSKYLEETPEVLNVPGEDSAVMTEFAQAIKGRMKKAIDIASGELLPEGVRVLLVDEIPLADGGKFSLGEAVASGENVALRYLPARDRRIVRQEAATLNDDGSVRVGRIVKPLKKDPDAQSRQQKPDETRIFKGVNDADGRVTAIEPSTYEKQIGIVSKLTYRFYDKGMAPASKNIGVSAVLPKAEFELKQHQDGAYEFDWSFVDPRWRNQKTATRVYNAIEKDLGIRLAPSGYLTYEGVQFWQKRSPESVRWHQKDPRFEGMYISPRYIINEINGINELIREAVDPNIISRLKHDRGTMLKMWGKLPPEARAAADDMLALGKLQALGKTDPYNLTISLAARAIAAEAQGKGVAPEYEAVRVFAHEVGELHKAADIFTDKEWKTLERAARKYTWADQTVEGADRTTRSKYEELYKDKLDKDALERTVTKESIFETFSEFYLRDRIVPENVKTIFTKLKEYIERVKNFLRGEGFNTYEDVFLRMEGGEFKRRLDEAISGEMAEPQTEDQMLALRGFYSPATRAAEKISMKKGTGEQFWKQITKTPGVKRDELEWMGLEEFLKDKKSVTRDEVLEFMDAHKIELDEKILGAQDEGKVSFNEIDIDTFRRHAGVVIEEFPGTDVEKIWSSIIDNNISYITITKSMSSIGDMYYILDGIEPIGRANSLESAKHIAREELSLLSEPLENAPRFEIDKVPGGENYREILLRLPNLAGEGYTDATNARIDKIDAEIAALESSGRSERDIDAERRALYREKNVLLHSGLPKYESQHFKDQEIVHVRMDDRVGPNGEKILFINEIQSDLHQDGRKYGYIGVDKTKLISELESKLEKIKLDITKKRVERRENSEKDNDLAFENKLVDLRSTRDRTETRLYDLTEANLPQVNAPFKGDLWLELALKRTLQYATENGYDAISWAKSEQIAKAVGADAEKLSVQYDQKIPRFLEKYTKKWGGGKFDEFNSEDSAEGYGNKLLRITPQMRASILEGQPYALGSSPKARQTEETLKNLRAELGLSAPTKAWKNGEVITPRQQMAAIAHAGPEQLVKIHRRNLALFLKAHGEAIDGLAFPRSNDSRGDGFRRFWSDFILRPDSIRQREPQLFDDFRDWLDANNSTLLEAIDNIHDVARADIAERGKIGVDAALSDAPGEPPKEPPTGFRGKMAKVADFWQSTFQPELVSDFALQADAEFARFKAATAQERDSILHSSEKQWEYWNKIPVEDQLKFIHDVEIGAVQTSPELAQVAARYRGLLDQAHILEALHGSKAGYFEDYFPHIWKQPEKARSHFKTMETTHQLGPRWFQKARYYDLIAEGRRAGLELKSTNPQELVNLRLLSGADMRMRMELLNNLKEIGVAREAKDSKEFKNAGWEVVNAPNGEQWLIAPDIRYLWKNAVEAKGLWSNENVAGSIFRGWMAFKNVWVPVKLALSMFHPLHVYHINMSQNIARGWGRITKDGDFGGAIKDMVTSFDSRQGVGYESRMAWEKTREQRTDSEQALVELMEDGGFVPQLSEQLRINARRQFQDAIDNHKWGKLLVQGTRRGIEKLQARFFERWIPGLKAAAYVKEARNLLIRRPDLMSDPIQRRVALRTISKSIDNRFGEMFYGGLFWNRTLKDSAIGSFLSLGWNLGFVREFGGAAAEPATRLFKPYKNASQTRQNIRDTANKKAFVLTYVATAMLWNGVMNYMFTGEIPDEKDVIFPRIGGTNPDGTPRRVTNMFYTREVPMIAKHIEERQSVLRGTGEMLWNKTLFQPFVEMSENRTYWGYEIWDEQAPWYNQWEQLAEHIVKEQLSPITVSGAERAAEVSGTWKDKGVPLAFLGFGPAPSYVERTPLENRIRYLFKQFVAPLKKPYARESIDQEKRVEKQRLLRAVREGDLQAASESRRKLRELGAAKRSLTTKRLLQPSATYLFSRLPTELQDSLLQNASPEEVNIYRKFVHKKLRSKYRKRISP